MGGWTYVRSALDAKGERHEVAHCEEVSRMLLNGKSMASGGRVQ
jgi:hypothetical protein